MSDKFQIEKILKEYDLGQIIAINDQSHGYANRNFSVKTSVREIFVRFCIQQDLVNIELEILLMSVLKQKAFRTAYPIPRKDGEYISILNDIPIVIYDYCSGDLPVINTKVVSEIARATGELSTLVYPMNLTKKNTISVSDTREIIRSKEFGKFSHADVKDSFVSLFKKLEEKISIILPTGIIHGDIFPDNTLFLNDKLIALIDFEEFAIDTLMFDVGMTINGFCYDGVDLDLELFEVFIKEYNQVRQFSEHEFELVVDYICWGAVGMTSWHLHQLLYRKNKKQLQRIRILLERARLVLDSRNTLEEHLSSIFN